MTTTVTGTDGVVPIMNTDGPWKIWRKSDIYVGQQGTARYVPNVGDWAIDTDLGGIEYEITSIDPATLIPIFTEIQPVASSGELTDNDLLLGVGPGTQSDTYRVYIDTSVTPAAVAVDQRLQLKGTAASYYRLFIGADLTAQGNIISHLYDSTGTIISDQIPLEIAQNVSGNVSVRVPTVCYTTTTVTDAEVITFVAYSASGLVVSKRQLLAENTSFIRSASIGTKYITGISLQSPFLSTMDPTVISLPINVTFSGINLLGVVHYSDGSTITLPVDGTKFSLYGANSYLSTVVGNQVSVVLNYRIDSSEIVYGSSRGAFPFLSKTYKLTTAQEDGAYSVKIFGYPFWQDAVNGYRMHYFLYNADRSLTYDVTSLVTYPVNQPAFQPTLYGTAQSLEVAVNLSTVNQSFKNYLFVQTLGVTLWGPGTQSTTPWTIQFTANQTPPYGTNLQATLQLVNSNYNILNLASGFSTLSDWLNAVYYPTLPLIDTFHEDAPLVPTHYRIRFGAFDQTFPISQWNVDTSIQNGLNNNDTVFIEFIDQTQLSSLQLAIAGMRVTQIPTAQQYL